MHYRTSPVSRSRAGFTLTELVVVMVVLTIVMSMVLPRLSASLRTDLDRGSSSLAWSLAYARTRALVTGKTWAVTIDMKTGAFWPHVEDPAKPGSAVDLSESEPPRLRRLARGVRVVDVLRLSSNMKEEAGRVSLRFQRRGLAEPSAIHLADRDDQVRTVHVRPFATKAEILSGYVDKEELEGGPALAGTGQAAGTRKAK